MAVSKHGTKVSSVPGSMHDTWRVLLVPDHEFNAVGCLNAAQGRAGGGSGHFFLGKEHASLKTRHESVQCPEEHVTHGGHCRAPNTSLMKQVV